MNFLNLFKSQSKLGQDEVLIAQLSEAGSDMLKPHNIDFFLYFSSPLTADKAREKIQSLYYDATCTVRESVQQKGLFIVEAKKVMVPTLASMIAIRKEFDEIAIEFSGAYDGWGSEIVN